MSIKLSVSVLHHDHDAEIYAGLLLVNESIRKPATKSRNLQTKWKVKQSVCWSTSSIDRTDNNLK